MVVDMELKRRINNVMKAMKEAKHYDMKVIWSNKLQQLLKINRRKQEYEGLQVQTRMVH